MNDEVEKIPIVTGSPDEIWLCYGDLEYNDTHKELHDNGEVLWCVEKQDPADVRYTRADIVDEKDAEIERLRIALEKYRGQVNQYGEHTAADDLTK